VIPALCVVLHAFLKRKVALCRDRYGSSARRPGSWWYAALAFSICVAFCGIVKVKQVRHKYDDQVVAPDRG